MWGGTTLKGCPVSKGSEDILAGFTAYYLTSLPVLLGVWFGVSFLDTGGAIADPVSACVRADAVNYLTIIRDGYSYDPNHRSLVAFFPAYPLLCRWVVWATGLPPEEAALLTSHIALLAAFVLLARWVRVRWPEATAGQRGVVLATFGLWPLGLFFRMPYAESLFLCGTLAVLYGMARAWPLPVLALLVGFVTAVRPVGVAVTIAFLWHVLTQPGLRPRAKAVRVMMLAPLACWGLLVYVGYQGLAFGTPWGFVQTQEHWVLGISEDRSWLSKLWALATLEPIWGVYAPDSRRYWDNLGVPGGPLFNLHFWNPILFLMAGVLLILGGMKRWLTGSELVLGICLLAIPYLTRSYEMSMASHGRFAAVVIVNYLVIGRILVQGPPVLRVAVYTTLALGICLFTSLYVASYAVF